MGKKERLRRDLAGVGPEPRRSGLHPLSGLKDFRISKGEPDIRGWEVRTLNGREVGRVDDLLVDTDAGEVVMMEIEMRGSERHIELPLRSAQIDKHASRVIVDSGDVELYAGGLAGDTRTPADLAERAVTDRDLDRIPDAAEDRARRERELALSEDPALRRRACAAATRTPRSATSCPPTPGATPTKWWSSAGRSSRKW
jgi:sporulation protein YlmC with PRC-barrel domain